MDSIRGHQSNDSLVLFDDYMAFNFELSEFRVFRFSLLKVCTEGFERIWSLKHHWIHLFDEIEIIVNFLFSVLYCFFQGIYSDRALWRYLPSYFQHSLLQLLSCFEYLSNKPNLKSFLSCEVSPREGKFTESWIVTNKFGEEGKNTQIWGQSKFNFSDWEDTK